MIAGLIYFATEAWASLWRGRSAAILSVLTIAIAGFVLGLFLLVAGHVQRTVDRWSRSAEMSVYLRDESTDGERAAVRSALRAEPSVAAIEFVSKSDALARFRKNFPDLAPAADSAADNPLPASFEVRLGSRPDRRPPSSGCPSGRPGWRGWQMSGTTGAGSTGWCRSGPSCAGAGCCWRPCSCSRPRSR